MLRILGKKKKKDKYLINLIGYVSHLKWDDMLFGHHNLDTTFSSDAHTTPLTTQLGVFRAGNQICTFLNLTSFLNLISNIVENPYSKLCTTISQLNTGSRE